MPLSPRDRRALVILGAVAGAALLLFLVARVLPGGEEAAAPPARSTPTVSPTASPAPGRSPAPVLEFSGRDPFATPAVFVTASPSPTGTPSPTRTPTTPGAGASRTVGGHTVVLLDVFTREGADMAPVEVDGTVYTVEEGEGFADGFRLVSASGTCARIRLGDESFTLCVSERK